MDAHLRDLRYFVAVAEELSFTGAAQRLQMSQQPVSATVRRLERQLGLRLFDRTTRHVSLTAAGRAVLPSARAAVEAADRFVRVADEQRDANAGVLRVGLSLGSSGLYVHSIRTPHRCQPLTRYARGDG